MIGTFSIEARDQDSNARAGELTLAHGSVRTPMFMPVGTLGAVKAVSHDALHSIIDAEIILANAYHLYLRPGTDVLTEAGGIHKFSTWEKPVLTDSGGYQVYSLSPMRKISEEGVQFRSHIDGSPHFFTPESVVDIQRKIGADIMMAFDECTPWPCTHEYAKASMEMTHRWLDRCLAHALETNSIYGYDQILAPIVQGSTYPDLRRISAAVITSKDMPINAIGGLSVGEPADEMYAMTAEVCSILPVDKPRYLMGVGTPVNLLEAIALGVDLFDCVLPSRNARHGLLYTWEGVINIKNEKWKQAHIPIDEQGCAWSRQYSRAYLRHLLMNNEILGSMIATVHNLSFYIALVREARKRILDGTFRSWKDATVVQLDQRL
jgi:queuine tRNA-ribosyltransferase